MATHTGPQGHLWHPWIISTSKGTRETVYIDILQIRVYIGYLYSFGIIGYLMYFGYTTILYGLEPERDRPPRLRHVQESCGSSAFCHNAMLLWRLCVITYFNLVTSCSYNSSRSRGLQPSYEDLAKDRRPESICSTG